MNVSLVILAAWWSAFVSPIVPVSPKVPSPVPGPMKPESPSTEVGPLNPKVPPPPEQIDTSKLPRVTQAPKFSFRAGNYSAESLKLPEVLQLEKFEHWQGGPNWPQLESAVVVVTDNSQDSQRFLAFLVDLKEQRVAAIRDGDLVKHFGTIGQGLPGDGKYQEGAPQNFMGLAGSGAVIILRPPVPPGPPGFPDDLVRRILDTGNIAAQAGLLMHGKLARG
ncbi:hypothetical protein [Nannocystis punicea]|uniref:Uncharacterized protein n=1 Tax=Nannocystis punicea TaxID=2995304 RepID=A0ABY7H3Y9_9BACT|nr:hypothetical protein [Nannocystis poenicansa]WAS94003.1 hypothetical protein O0S08_48360 [Nannocystis poenicansa]